MESASFHGFVRINSLNLTLHQSNLTMRYLLQYHNFEYQGGFPASDAGNDEKIGNILHTITSKKRKLVLNAKGDTIFLVVGIKIKKGENKKYFLWSKTIVNHDEPKPDDDGYYDLVGTQHWLCPPQYLNELDGFDIFLHKSGHFSVCLVDISSWEFTKELIRLSAEFKCKNPMLVSFKQFKENFRNEVNRVIP